MVILSAAKDLLLLSGCTVLACAITTAVPAQTLAQPGWKNSGLNAEHWWRNAIFYRVDVPHFQDSDGDGRGDLPGIAQRLDYLQSLGVDAIIVAADPADDTFGDLVRAANARHLRVLVSLRPDPHILDLARLWLTRGAAGLYTETAQPDTHLSTHELRSLVDSFPGERILLDRPGTDAPPSEAHLVVTPLGSQPPAVPSTEPSKRTRKPAAAHPAPLPASEQPGNIAGALQKTSAAQLYTVATAVLVRSGQEIGLQTPSPLPWTPTNITPPKPAEPVAEEPAKPEPPPDPSVYGAFKPYVPPRPKPAPKPPGAPPDPATLPGFTTGKLLDPPAPNAATANVALEDADPLSLLNFYRRLAQLHHDNPALRSGAIIPLDHANALACIHQAPASARNASPVVVAANLTDQPMQLPLEDDFKKLRLHNGSLRPLLASWTADAPSLSSYNLILPPRSVYIGELYRSSATR